MDELEAQLARYGEALERAAAEDGAVAELATARRRPRKIRWLAAAAMALVAAGSIAVAVDDGDDRVGTADRGPVSSVADVVEFARMVSGPVGEIDREGPPASPDEWATYASLIVIGEVDGFEDGRTMVVAEPLDTPMVTMTVRVDEVIQGTLPEGADGRVYVELGLAPMYSAAEYEAVAPNDLRVALYLDAAAGHFPEYVDDAADRPAGQPLWRAIVPEGLVIDDGRGGVLQPVEYKEFPRSTLRDFVPPNDHWPTPASPPVLHCAEGEGFDGGVGDVLHPYDVAAESVLGAVQRFVPGPRWLPRTRTLRPVGAPPEPGYAVETEALTTTIVSIRDDGGRLVAWLRVRGTAQKGWSASDFMACHGWFEGLPARAPFPPAPVVPECDDVQVQALSQGQRRSCALGFLVGETFYAYSGCGPAVRPSMLGAMVAEGAFQLQPTLVREIVGVDPRLLLAVRSANDSGCSGATRRPGTYWQIVYGSVRDAAEAEAQQRAACEVIEPRQLPEAVCRS